MIIRYRRPALITYPQTLESTNSENKSQPQHVTAYAIASVFTPSENRGKGYASHMMRLIHWVLGSPQLDPSIFPQEVWGDPPVVPSFAGDGLFSVLYSDVGRVFYEKCGHLPGDITKGWVVRGGISTVWKVNELNSVGDRVQNDSWRWLDEESTKKIWEIDATIMALEMGNNKSSEIKLAFSPQQGVASFMVERYKPHWEKIIPKPIHWGICKAGDLDASVFATWTITPQRSSKSFSLLITRLRCPPELFKSLFEQILAHAKSHNVETIEAWNLPKDLIEFADVWGARTFEREEKLPSLKWYGRQDANVDWILNEK